MTCPAGACPPPSGARCRSCPIRSENLSSNIFEEAPAQITSPTGSREQGVPFRLRRSSGQDKALLLLNEAYNEVALLDNSRARSIAMTKIEEAEMWLTKVARA